MAVGRRRFCLASFLPALALIVGCGDDPPQIEMQQAQQAIEGARAAGADEYAHDELAAAEGALARARAAVDERDYRLALNHSLDSRERAQTAATQAASQKAAARAEAERALGNASATLAEARTRLKAAQTSGAPARRLAAAVRSIAAGDQAVQKARAAFNQGSFRDVALSLNEPMTRLAATSHDLEAAPRLAGRRRR
jgi:Domain of unknown function (DUF4398)